MQDLHPIERALLELSPDDRPQQQDWLSQSVSLIMNGEYEEFINSKKAEKISEIFGWNDADLNSENFAGFIASKTDVALQYSLTSTNASLEILVACVGYFYAFLKANWVGPLLKLPMTSLSAQAVSVESLAVDGEECYGKVLFPELFLRALIWARIADRVGLGSGPLWALRFTFYHQQLLENPTFSLKKNLDLHLGSLKGSMPEDPHLAARLWLEFGIIHNFFQERSKTRECFHNAQEVHQFAVELTGAMGKRTRFQTYETAQLVVRAESALLPESPGARPKEAENPDDTLLPTPSFSVDVGTTNLHVIDQAILLALCLNVKNQNPKHGLTTAEMHPYVRKALEHSNNWLVHSMGLLIRSRLEVESTKTLERATLQVQALVDQFLLEEEAPVQERMRYVFMLAFPSYWQLKLETALLYGRIGSALSALQIFLELESWEHAIDCYRVTNQLEEAEKLCLAQLEQQPNNAKIYCLLGDVKADPQFYEKAWEVVCR